MNLVLDTEKAIESVQGGQQSQPQGTDCPQGGPAQATGATTASRPASACQFRAYKRSRLAASLMIPVQQAHSPILLHSPSTSGSSSDAETPVPASQPCPCSAHQSVASSGSNNFGRRSSFVSKPSRLGSAPLSAHLNEKSSGVIGPDAGLDGRYEEVTNKFARLRSPSKTEDYGLHRAAALKESIEKSTTQNSLGSGITGAVPAAVNMDVARQAAAPQKPLMPLKRRIKLPTGPCFQSSTPFSPHMPEGSSSLGTLLHAVPPPLSAPAGSERSTGKIPISLSSGSHELETSIVPVVRRSRSEPVLPSNLIRGAGQHHLAVSDRFISDAAFRDFKKQQRQPSKNVYSSDYFFPSADNRLKNSRILDEDKLSRVALARAPQFVCLKIHGCTRGDCLHGLLSSDVQKMRQEYMSKSISSSLFDVLHIELTLFYDRLGIKWNDVNVSLDASVSVKCCPISFCLLVGASPSTAARVLLLIENGEEPARKTLMPSRELDRRTQVSLDWAMLTSYVKSLLDKNEADPAPGAHQPHRLTHISKTTWKQKWDNCCQYFKEADRIPGSKTMLKRAWRQEHRLKERRAKSHSKCCTCSKIDSDTQRLSGVNTDAARITRAYLKRLFEEHEAYHLEARSVLDEAGLNSIADPRYIWTICVDAATQRNFELPKFQFRPPKSFAGRPFWGFKLMATFVYGDGFYPFLIHDSQKYGANLTWTVIWLTLCELYRKRGYWPSVLHIQLDNTTGENKNEVMLMVAAWLVASGKIKQVRVFFLPVGHTHIVIDHIFGIITIGLRRKELLLPRELMKCIDESMANNPQYNAKPTRWLHALWDFSNWAAQQIGVDPALGRLFGGEVQDENGTYTGMYDFIFNKCPTLMASLQYREHCSHSLLPSSGPCRVILSMPTGPPKLQEIKPKSQWAYCSSHTVLETLQLAIRFARSVFTVAGEQLVLDTWKGIIDDVPTSICFLKSEYKLTFEYFDNSTLPRITNHGAHDHEEEDAEEASYEEWKRRFAGFRTAPMAVDPVTSSQQSKAEFEQAKNAYLATIGMHGPSIAQSSPILMGNFVLVKPAGARSVRLGCVRKLGHMETPFSENLNFSLLEYEHTPNGEVSGFFGTFKVHYVVTASKRCESRMKCQRNEVVVFNAELKNIGKNARVLSLDTLRCLARAMPDEYPMPATDKLPTTHITKSKTPSAPRKRGSRRLSRICSSSDDSSEEDEENDEDDENDDEDDDDDEPEDDEEEDDDEDEAEDEDVEAEDKDGLNDAGSGRTNEITPLSNVSNGAGADEDSRATDSLTRTSVQPISLEDVKEGSLRFLFMGESSEREYKDMKYPVGLVFVRAIEGKTLHVYWFQREGGRKDFDPKLKNQTYAKWWKDPKWLKKLKLKRNEFPTTDQIFDNWFASTADIESVVNVEIPQDLYEASNVVQKDRFRVPTDFVTKVLLPICSAKKE